MLRLNDLDPDSVVPLNSSLNQVFRAVTSSGKPRLVKLRAASEYLVPAEVLSDLRNWGVKLPRHIASGTLEDGTIFEVQEFFVSERLLDLWRTLSTSARRDLMERCAGIAVRLHSIPRSAFSPSVNELDLCHSVARLASTMPWTPEDVSFVQRLAPRIDSCPRVLCHGDFNLTNVLRTPEGELVLVDWEWTCLANPAFDLKNLRLWIEYGYEDLGELVQVYLASSRFRPTRAQLLLADLYLSCKLILLARRRQTGNWARFHERRSRRLIGRLQAELG